MNATLRTLSPQRACVLVLACLAPLAARADDDATRIRAIVDATIRPLMAQQDIPGMAVAVTLGGQAWVFDYGVASKESGAPVTDATLFEIGSVTKTLTATLATYAQATGRLALTDHPSRHVPALKGRPIDQATLIHLGTYTAGGLPLQFPEAVPDDDAGALAWLRAWTPAAKPGVEREYSNPSLGLLGHVTARAFKLDFAQALETELLPRLGLRHTWIHVPPSAQGDYAWGYRQGKPVHAGPGPFDQPTYGIRTTAADLIRFVQLNIDPSGLEPAVRSAVEATHVGWYRAGGMVQGLGWEQYPWPVSREWLLGGNAAEMIEDAVPVLPAAAPPAPAPRLFDKTGSTGGFGAYVAFVPSRRLGLVMLANRNYPIPARVEAGWAILHQLVPDERP